MNNHNDSGVFLKQKVASAEATFIFYWKVERSWSVHSSWNNTSRYYKAMCFFELVCEEVHLQEICLKDLMRSSGCVANWSFWFEKNGKEEKSFNRFEQHLKVVWSKTRISVMHAWARRFQENLFLRLPAMLLEEGNALSKCTQPSQQCGRTSLAVNDGNDWIDPMKASLKAASSHSNKGPDEINTTFFNNDRPTLKSPKWTQCWCTWIHLNVSCYYDNWCAVYLCLLLFVLQEGMLPT